MWKSRRQNKQAAEGEEHFAGGGWRIVRAEPGCIFGEKPALVRFVVDRLQLWPQSGAFVPLEDGFEIRHDLQIVGCPEIEVSCMGRENPVVMLQVV